MRGCPNVAWLDIETFNQEEIKIFRDCGFAPVFFGEAIIRRYGDETTIELWLVSVNPNAEGPPHRVYPLCDSYAQVIRYDRGRREREARACRLNSQIRRRVEINVQPLLTEDSVQIADIETIVRLFALQSAFPPESSRRPADDQSLQVSQPWRGFLMGREPCGRQTI